MGNDMGCYCLSNDRYAFSSSGYSSARHSCSYCYSYCFAYCHWDCYSYCYADFHWYCYADFLRTVMRTVIAAAGRTVIRSAACTSIRNTIQTLILTVIRLRYYVYVFVLGLLQCVHAVRHFAAATVRPCNRVPTAIGGPTVDHAATPRPRTGKPLLRISMFLRPHLLHLRPIVLPVSIISAF
jgi:hypothetical protein